MSQKNRSDLYEEFRNGDIPNENDFADTIDSALNLVDDGLTSYKVSTAVGLLKRFGIGDTAPNSPLGIKGEPGQDNQMISFTSNDASQKWNINLNPTSGNVTGFSIDDTTSGVGYSRLFIDQVSEGNVGIGTVTPEQKLHVQGANDGANVSIMVENLESGTGGGWLMSAIDDNTVTERTKTFAIQEKNGADLIERVTVLGITDQVNPILNVGINEAVPMATLQVTRAAADPLQKINLAENTGILVLGPIDDQNLGMDSSQIQARTGEYIAATSTLSFTATELALQPYGGDIIINKTLAPSSQVAISSDGKIGIGKVATEKVEINGAITVGDTSTVEPPDGTIRWSAVEDDLQVWKDAQWNSLTTHTTTDGLWQAAGDGVIFYNLPEGQHPKVGIGTIQVGATLHVKETNRTATASSVATAIVNQAQTASLDSALSRGGLVVSNSGPWNANPAALDIGVYVSGVTGQTAPASNIAALFNGNTVIGNITGNSIIGEGGTNVLAIQTGHSPTSIPGLTGTSGIQIYSSTVTTAAGDDISVFNLMNGDENVIQLYRQPDMTPADINAPNTGNAVTDALIVNMRTRIGQLEDILKALGILEP